MPGKRSLLWAELKRGSEALLVPSMAWEAAIFARGRSAGREEDAWDEALGAWRVSTSQAALFAELVQTVPVTCFGESMGSQDFTPFALGTVIGQALDPAAASDLKAETRGFLARGDFTWRFVSL